MRGSAQSGNPGESCGAGQVRSCGGAGECGVAWRGACGAGREGAVLWLCRPDGVTVMKCKEMRGRVSWCWYVYGDPSAPRREGRRDAQAFPCYVRPLDRIRNRLIRARSKDFTGIPPGKSLLPLRSVPLLCGEPSAAGHTDQHTHQSLAAARRINNLLCSVPQRRLARLLPKSDHRAQLCRCSAYKF
ncbi:hypothetical protein O3P69_000716 [Scylla paramamosain]|uniref:Uncharacterized protein n=1 Tax=Scylla paramamosain TaxID=85552 RepID=A0AAW0URV7_SCYPA